MEAGTKVVEGATRSMGIRVSIRRAGVASKRPKKGETEERNSSMVGYMSLEEQVDADFSRASRKALLGRVRTRLQRGNASIQLLCFDDLRRIPGALGRIHRGIRTVPVAQIVGSVGRCSEFDRDFMPTRASVEERWKRVDRAFHRGEELPPVSLYKVGGFYFVLDGHHRVSVASYHGVEWIDAEVTEFGTGGGEWRERRYRESA